MRLSVLAAAPLVLLSCTSTTRQAEPVAAEGVTGTMFVANKRGASLSRIDLATGEETHRSDTCENPHELTVSPDRRHVMVACYSGQTLEIFETDTLTRHNIYQLGDNARVHSAIWTDNFTALAGAEGRGSLYIVPLPLSTRTSPTEIGGGGPGPHLIAVNEDATTAWGTIIPTGEVVRYSVNGLVEARRVRIGNQIEALALSPDGETLWVSSNADSIAYRLNAMTLEIEAEVPTGQVPIRLAMHPSGDFVVSSNYGTGDLTVIDTATNEVVRTIPVSGSSDAVQVTLVFSENGSRLYAAETATDTIAEVDFASGEVLRRIPTGPGGDGLAVID